jgi:hypothetical protein
LSAHSPSYSVANETPASRHHPAVRNPAAQSSRAGQAARLLRTLRVLAMTAWVAAAG